MHVTISNEPGMRGQGASSVALTIFPFGDFLSRHVAQTASVPEGISAMEGCDLGVSRECVKSDLAAAENVDRLCR